jgi:hypothetical protein
VVYGSETSDGCCRQHNTETATDKKQSDASEIDRAVLMLEGKQGSADDQGQRTQYPQPGWPLTNQPPIRPLRLVGWLGEVGLVDWLAR